MTEAQKRWCEENFILVEQETPGQFVAWDLIGSLHRLPEGLDSNVRTEPCASETDAMLDIARILAIPTWFYIQAIAEPFVLCAENAMTERFERRQRLLADAETRLTIKGGCD